LTYEALWRGSRVIMLYSRTLYLHHRDTVDCSHPHGEGDVRTLRQPPGQHSGRRTSCDPPRCRSSGPL